MMPDQTLAADVTGRPALGSRFDCLPENHSERRQAKIPPAPGQLSPLRLFAE